MTVGSLGTEPSSPGPELTELSDLPSDASDSTLTVEVSSVGGTAVPGVVVGVLVVLLAEVEPSVIVGAVWWPGFCHTDTSEEPIEGNSASRTAHAAPEVPTMMPSHNAIMTRRRDDRRLDPAPVAAALS